MYGNSRKIFSHHDIYINFFNYQFIVVPIIKVLLHLRKYFAPIKLSMSTKNQSGFDIFWLSSNIRTFSWSVVRLSVVSIWYVNGVFILGSSSGSEYFSTNECFKHSSVELRSSGLNFNNFSNKSSTWVEAFGYRSLQTTFGLEGRESKYRLSGRFRMNSTSSGVGDPITFKIWLSWSL